MFLGRQLSTNRACDSMRSHGYSQVGIRVTGVRFTFPRLIAGPTTRDVCGSFLGRTDPKNPNSSTFPNLPSARSLTFPPPPFLNVSEQASNSTLRAHLSKHHSEKKPAAAVSSSSADSSTTSRPIPSPTASANARWSFNTILFDASLDLSSNVNRT